MHLVNDSVVNEGCILKPIGVRSVQGHSFSQWIEDDRYSVPLDESYEDLIPGLVHHTQIENVQSILEKGLIPGGVNDATGCRRHIHMSVFDAADERVADSKNCVDTLIYPDLPFLLRRRSLFFARAGTILCATQIPPPMIRCIWYSQSMLGATWDREKKCEPYNWIYSN